VQTVIQVIGGQDGGYHRDREWRAVNDTERRQYRLSQIIVLQAGRAAVDRLCKRKLPYADWEAGSDHKLALKRAMWLSNDNEQAAQLLLQWAVVALKYSLKNVGDRLTSWRFTC